MGGARAACSSTSSATSPDERKYANKLLCRLRGPERKGRRGAGGRGREKNDGTEVTGVLFEIWERSEQPCGKRLAPMLANWLPFYEKHLGGLAEETREAVLAISAAQIDRVLAPKKTDYARPGLRGTKKLDPRAPAARPQPARPRPADGAVVRAA